MSKKRYRPEEIIGKLREADILISQGKKVVEVIKALGITDVTYYRWRQEFGGMSVPQAKRLKELEKENERLRKAVSDLTLDKMILKEVAKGNFLAPHGGSTRNGWNGPGDARELAEIMGPARKTTTARSEYDL
jgi:putative transposase